MKIVYFVFIAVVVGCSDSSNKKVEASFDYYPNGIVKSLGYYKDTSLNGQFFRYYPNGKVDQIVSYVKGLPNGYVYEFYESGALKSTLIYKGGKQVGYAAEYYDHSLGMLKTIRVFSEDSKLRFIRQYDSSGKIIRQEGKY